MKKLLTRKKLIEDIHLVRTICLFGIFGIVGLFGPVYGLYMVITEPCKNSYIGLAFLTVFPGLVFGYFIFWRNVKSVLKQVSCLKNGDFIVVIDEVVDKEMYSDSDSGYRYMLDLKKFSTESGRLLTVTRSDYNKCKKGSQCILILEQCVKYPSFYRADTYELDTDLRSHVVGNFESYALRKKWFKS